MRTLLFANRVVDPVRTMTGIGRYVAEITRALARARQSSDGEMTLAGPAEMGDPTWLPDGVGYSSLPRPRKAVHLSWMALRRPAIARYVGDFDLVHALHPSFPIPTRQPGVITIHDLMPLEHPEWYQRDEIWGFRVTLERSAQRGWHVIADSEHVGRLLYRLGQFDPSKISVVHLAVDDAFRRPVSPARLTAVTRSHGVEPGNYFLALGNVSTRKNLGLLVRAFAGADTGKLKLLLAGRPHTSASTVRKEIERSGVGERVVLGGFVEDAELPALVQGALALFHPSVDEGFGIPPLEAMAAGTAVLAADAGSLPEIVGDAGVLLAAQDEQAWSDAITAIAQDSADRARLGELGRRRADRFTWDRAAHATLAVHRLALSGG